MNMEDRIVKEVLENNGAWNTQDKAYYIPTYRFKRIAKSINDMYGGKIKELEKKIKDCEIASILCHQVYKKNKELNKKIEEIKAEADFIAEESFHEGCMKITHIKNKEIKELKNEIERLKKEIHDSKFISKEEVEYQKMLNEEYGL